MVFAFGDGTACEYLEMVHSQDMSTMSGSSCVICTKALLLFDGMQKHVSFEETLRTSPLAEWCLTWEFHTPEVASWHQFSKQAARVSLMVKHRRGYSWGIGSFMLHPDPRVSLPGVAERQALPNDYGTILSLDGCESAFSSTLGQESVAKIGSWMKECHSNHKKCHRLFRSDSSGPPVAPWFPDRLIRVTRTEIAGTGRLSTRLVLTSDLADFPAGTTENGVRYLSFSHCWGPEPKGGRDGSVLARATFDMWRKELPIGEMPLAFQHAVTVCGTLGFDHIWIDSLCIRQDDEGDWQEQSAVMADVYKHAWLNIAALSTRSDYEGFINDDREPRALFGFRAPFAPILGEVHATDRNLQGRPCVLLDGEATLLWDIQPHLPGGSDRSEPLSTRAWVYQEQTLARRTLAFATHGVFFACDEASYGENPECLSGVCSSGFGTRHLLHTIVDRGPTMAAEVSPAGRAPSPPEQDHKAALDLLQLFGSTWYGAISDYTRRKLTKDTDRLVAISAVAREMARLAEFSQQQYYFAGLWITELIFQLAWTSGYTNTQPRKHVGSKGYVAPSWSWASIEAPVTNQCEFFPDESRVRALADVRAVDVELASEFAFGPVRAGWLRLWGCPKAVTASCTKPNYDSGDSALSTSLTDAATGEELWFSSDTTEGSRMVASRAGLRKVVWVPLILNAHAGMVSCEALVLAELSPGEETGGGAFIKAGEKVYRRLGTGSFGRIPSLFRQDKLLMALGTYPEATRMEDVVHGFVRNKAGYQEFVII